MSFFKRTPILVQLMLTYYGIPLYWAIINNMGQPLISTMCQPIYLSLWPLLQWGSLCQWDHSGGDFICWCGWIEAAKSPPKDDQCPRIYRQCVQMQRWLRLRPWSTLWLVWPRGLLWPFMWSFGNLAQAKIMSEEWQPYFGTLSLFHWSTR